MKDFISIFNVFNKIPKVWLFLQSNVPKCLCDPGYGGDRCDSPFKWVEFGPGSFVEYDVKVGLEDRTTNVDVLFLPGKANAGTGELGFAGAGEKVNLNILTFIRSLDLNG